MDALNIDKMYKILNLLKQKINAMEGGGGGLSTVTLTQAEYNALVASSSVKEGVFYMIKDEVDDAQ